MVISHRRSPFVALVVFLLSMGWNILFNVFSYTYTIHSPDQTNNDPSYYSFVGSDDEPNNYNISNKGNNQNQNQNQNESIILYERLIVLGDKLDTIIDGLVARGSNTFIDSNIPTSNTSETIISGRDNIINNDNQNNTDANSFSDDDDSNIFSLHAKAMHSEKPIQVVLWPEGQHHSEYIHVYEDGIDQSPYLIRSHNLLNFFLHDDNNKSSQIVINANTSTNINQSNMVWVGIANAMISTSEKEWCDEYERKIRIAQEERYKQGLPKCCWHIYIVDYTDNPTSMKCPGIEDAMGSNFIHYAQRSTVEGRHWNTTSQWIDPGRRIDNIINSSSSSVSNSLAMKDTTKVHIQSERAATIINNQTDNDNQHYSLHLNYPVRTDIVRTLARMLNRHHRASLSDPIESSCCGIDRPIDVTHFWPLDNNNTRMYSKVWYPKFRWRVSSILQNYCDQNNYTSYIGLAGKQNEKGRRKVSNQYIDMMLKSKIIVVSQRDGWEDHYRLMEAIVSGAMIMTDSMLSLPDGYQDGISIVEYDSARDLKDKVTYYLQHTSERQSIAAKGRRLAMTKHRSWHRMEELIFGTILTNCHPPPQNENGNSNGNTSTSSASACPFVINAC